MRVKSLNGFDLVLGADSRNEPEITQLALLRFFNCDLTYSDDEISATLAAMKNLPPPDRVAFFEQILVRCAFFLFLFLR